MTWTTVGEALPDFALTDADMAQVEKALDAAAAWAAGEIPFNQAITSGMATSFVGFASPSFTRMLAEKVTRGTGDVRRPALLRLVDAALTQRGKVLTDFGLFTPAEIRESDERVAAANVSGRND